MRGIARGFCVLLVSLFVWLNDAAATGRYAILQGATDETSTQLAILAPKGAKLTFRLRDNASFITPYNSTRASRSFSSQAVHQVSFQGLTSGHLYEFEVLDSGGKVLDRRQLSTIAKNLNAARIAIVSCIHDRFVAEGAPLWAHLLELRPQLIFMVGDNVYADTFGPADPEKLWRRYAETRERLPVFRAQRLVPILATWDDHDFGANDADSSYRFKDAARTVFQAFFAQTPGAGGIVRGPGVSTRIDLFKQRFLFMDNRTFRNTHDRAGILTHWGEDQNRWFVDNIARGSGPIWLINGSQFFGGYHKYESFEREHPEDLRRVLKELSRSPWPTLFISGDRHLSEVLEANWPELGYRSVELTSSGIHSFVNDPASRQMPRGLLTPSTGPILGPYHKRNFMIVDVDLRSPPSSGLRIQVAVFGPKKEIGFSSKYEIRR